MIGAGDFVRLAVSVGSVHSRFIVRSVRGAARLRVKSHLWSSSACFVFGFGAMGGGVVRSDFLVFCVDVRSFADVVLGVDDVLYFLCEVVVFDADMFWAFLPLLVFGLVRVATLIICMAWCVI